jgi:hypothetical protein
MYRRPPGRVDAAEAIQNAHLAVSDKFPGIAPPPPTVVFLAKIGGRYVAGGCSLGEHWLGTLTAASQTAMRAESKIRLRDAAKYGYI